MNVLSSSTTIVGTSSIQLQQQQEEGIEYDGVMLPSSSSRSTLIENREIKKSIDVVVMINKNILINET
jgi:hypothetical protein